LELSTYRFESWHIDTSKLGAIGGLKVAPNGFKFPQTEGFREVLSDGEVARKTLAGSNLGQICRTVDGVVVFLACLGALG